MVIFIYQIRLFLIMSILGIFFIIGGIGGLSRHIQSFLTTGVFPQFGLFISATMLIFGISRVKSGQQRKKDAADAAKYRESMDADTIFRGKRPSPSTSATSVNIGTVMRGGNGKLWVCRSYKRGNNRVKRWVGA